MWAVKLLLISILIASSLGRTKVNHLAFTNPKTTGAQNVAAASPIPITYHGGPVMTTSPIQVYYIYYGNFVQSSQDLLTSYTNGLNNSAWWLINRNYSIASTISYGGSTQVPVTLTTLSTSNIQTIIKNAINAGKVGPTAGSANAIYFVLTDKTVTQKDGRSSFCNNFCGWHDHFTYLSKDIKYGFIGSATRCPSACSALNSTNSPNNNFEIDSMISVISHELAESTSDPDLNAWYDSRGYENADKCAWTFGKTFTGTPANTVQGLWNEEVGASKYYIQMNWGRFPTQQCYN